MSDYKLYDQWWRDTVGEEGMEEEHLPFWHKVIASIEERNLEKYEVLDFGCNQGGFLRTLFLHKPFKRALGIDLAKKSVEIANQRKGQLPLEYKAVISLDEFENKFDMATSSAVIYLIDDLDYHAEQIKKALKPGGIYYASYTDQENKPSEDILRSEVEKYGEVKMADTSLEKIADAFAKAGFKVQLRRMEPNFYTHIARPDRWYPNIKARMDTEYNDMYMFKFTAPENE